jgi:phospholipid-translocating ATPase
VLRRPDEEVEYELLCSMEFTSDRKRMSVIVKLPDGKLKLYSKGADSVMLERLKEGEDDDVRRKTKKQLHELAKSGLRTLILAEKELSQEECDKFLEQYKEASSKIDDREEAVRVVRVSCRVCRAVLRVRRVVCCVR